MKRRRVAYTAGSSEFDLGFLLRTSFMVHCSMFIVHSSSEVVGCAPVSIGSSYNEVGSVLDITGSLRIVVGSVLVITGSLRSRYSACLHWIIVYCSRLSACLHLRCSRLSAGRYAHHSLERLSWHGGCDTVARATTAGDAEV